MTEQKNDQYSNEVDLIGLIAKLWKEKLTILASIIITSSLGILYITLSAPTYSASTQLTAPTENQLDHFNRTDFFTINPETAFKAFLETLESDSHLSQLIQNNPELLDSALNLKNEQNIEELASARRINYPDTSKKTNSLTPDKYSIYYQGANREELKKLILEDLLTAKEQTVNNIHLQYKTTLSNKASSMLQKQELALKNLDDELKARKALVLATRKDNLKELEEALKIAKALNLNSPTSLNKLSNNLSSKQVEINAELNNNHDPLYLRGTRLLKAEIQNLRELDDTEFLDSEVRRLESTRIVLENNREIEQLNVLTQEDLDSKNVRFYSETISSSNSPIKPKKAFTLIISILAGFILGVFIAIGRIIYSEQKIA